MFSSLYITKILTPSVSATINFNSFISSSSTETSINSLTELISILIPTLATNIATTTDAIGSNGLNPKIEPPIPIKAATEDKASDL